MIASRYPSNAHIAHTRGVKQYTRGVRKGRILVSLMSRRAREVLGAELDGHDARDGTRDANEASRVHDEHVCKAAQ